MVIPGGWRYMSISACYMKELDRAKLVDSEIFLVTETDITRSFSLKANKGKVHASILSSI